MPESDNLSDLIEKRLPAELMEFMQEAGLAAAAGGQSLYLVGGVVRDLLLGRTNLDLDLAVTGDAITFSKQFNGIADARMVTHPRFHTVKLSRGSWSVDIATVRAESYDRPGALPAVRSGTIKEDLFRRDFTINAMAVELTPKRWGRVIDLYGGRDDLKNGLVRILHDDSFIDDATRIWRAIRYEQRLGFKLEPKTLRLLKSDVGMLETISADRIRHELELVLKEKEPEKVVRRAEKLGALAQIYPALKGDAWLARKFKAARKANAAPLADIYLALLAYRLGGAETEKLIARLRLSKAQARLLVESNKLKDGLEALDEPVLQPSLTYAILSEYGETAIASNLLAADSASVKKNIRLFLDKLSHIKPSLTGKDLQTMGISPGPQMKAILHQLLEARLDGEVNSRRGEVEWVERWR